MVPLAHMAMYKVTDGDELDNEAVFSAIQTAISDGVDVISISIGGAGRYLQPFHIDPIALATCQAIQSGICVTCSAGNTGPFRSSLSNEAPWVLTVGASHLDRKITALVYLGNGELIEGQSSFKPKGFPHRFMPLVYPGLNGGLRAGLCVKGSLDHMDVKGKIVVCHTGGRITRIGKARTIKDAGGVGMIPVNQHYEGDYTNPCVDALPTSHVSYVAGIAIRRYIISTSSLVATIRFHGDVTGVHTAPKVASFSSRGPSKASPGILKPDIIAPRVSIVAAWPVSVDERTETKAVFNTVYGSSMSCPHIAGIMASLKNIHPDWSPAAIKSAIMTTADQVTSSGQPIMDERGQPAGAFAMGAGHVNASKASDPVLVFDIEPDDYIPYMLGLGYTADQVEVVVRNGVACSKVIEEAQLNYPSFVVTLAAGDVKTYTRTVTNVGEAKATYRVQIHLVPSMGVTLRVDPEELKFAELNQKLTY